MKKYNPHSTTEKDMIKMKKLFLIFSLLFVLAYLVLTLYVHYKAVPALIDDLHPSYPELKASDLCIESLPFPTRDRDIQIQYSFVYNEYGEKLYLTYYLNHTRPIMVSK